MENFTFIEKYIDLIEFVYIMQLYIVFIQEETVDKVNMLNARQAQCRSVFYYQTTSAGTRRENVFGYNCGTEMYFSELRAVRNGCRCFQRDISGGGLCRRTTLPPVFW